MSEEDIRALFEEQNRLIETRFREILGALAEPLKNGNAIYAESEKRAREMDEFNKARAIEDSARTEKRVTESDSRAERQVRSWERIADALTQLANK